VFYCNHQIITADSRVSSSCCWQRHLWLDDY